MKLKDLCKVKIGNENADFWVVRRGDIKQVGKPTFKFNPEHYGIKVIKTNLIVPKWLYYVFMHLHNAKYFEPLATGTLNLVNIKIEHINEIEFKQ